MAITKTPARGATHAVKINGNFVNIPGLDGVPRIGRGAKVTYENTSIDDTARTFGTDLPQPPSYEIAGAWDSNEESHVFLLASQGNVAALEEFKTFYRSGATETHFGRVTQFDVEALQGQDERFYMTVQISGTVNYVAAT